MAEDNNFFTVDPDEAFETLPEGEYTTYVTEVEKKKKEGGEFSYIEVTMKVADGQYEGWLLTDRLTENPAARWRLARVVKAAGLAKAGEVGERQFRLESLKGCILVVKVEHEDYKGMKQARPGRYTMHDSVKQRLEAEEKGEATEPAQGDPAASAAAPAATPPADAKTTPAVPKKTPPPPPKPANKVKV